MLYKYKDKFPEADQSAFIAPTADIIGEVKIGESSSIWYGAVLRGDDLPIVIGKGSNVQDNCVIHITPMDHSVFIGDYVTVGHSAVLHGCSIGNNCIIGMGSIILDGAEIGENTIVGAGSLVTEKKKIPSGVLCFGSPAKVIRELTAEEINYIRNNAQHYIEKIK